MTQLGTSQWPDLAYGNNLGWSEFRRGGDQHELANCGWCLMVCVDVVDFPQELHAHLNGSLSVSTLRKLAALSGETVSEEDIAFEKGETLEEYENQYPMLI